MANGGSAATGAIEGFLGGFERGAQFRRQRTADQQTAEEIRNRRIAEELERGRVGRQEDQDLAFRNIASQEEFGAVFDPEQAEAIQRESVQLRQGVAERLRSGGFAPGLSQLSVGLESGTEGLPPGFVQAGQSRGERELESVTALRTSVSAYLTATEEEKAVMEQDPQVIGALHELGLLTGVMSRSAAAAQPVSPSPAQRFIGEEGFQWTFDPRGSQDEMVQPLLGPSGEQMRGPEPVDNFSRSAAVSAANAISRIDPMQFTEADFELQPDMIARRFGFVDAAHVQQVLSAAVGGGADVGGGERSAQELWDAAAEEIGREEALRRLGPRPNG